MEENVDVRPRRRHGAEFKAEAVKACMQPGISIAAVALRYRLNANLLRQWGWLHSKSLMRRPKRASR
jgi:transposase